MKHSLWPCESEQEIIDFLAEHLNGSSPWTSKTWQGHVYYGGPLHRESVSLPPLSSVRGITIAFDGRWYRTSGMQCGLAWLDGNGWLAWETYADVTGDGFVADAYGGDADVFWFESLSDAVAFGLTDDGRRMLGVRDSRLPLAQ